MKCIACTIATAAMMLLSSCAHKPAARDIVESSEKFCAAHHENRTDAAYCVIGLYILHCGKDGKKCEQ